MLRDFLSLVFADTCIGCNTLLYKSENYICTRCRVAMPSTDYHRNADNILSRRFWGRVPLTTTVAYLKFAKGGIAQKLLYEIKYKGKSDLARILGHWYGNILISQGFSEKIDGIVPVPLHKRKQKIRGFNQSSMFAEGLGKAMDIEVREDVLQRISHKESQTGKLRFDRWLNVKDVYILHPKREFDIRDKHLMIIDDVITTGATIEACARELLSGGAREVSVAAIAAAE